MLRCRVLLPPLTCAALLASSPAAIAGQFDYTTTYDPSDAANTTGSWTTPAGASVVQVLLQGAGGGSGRSVLGGTGGDGGRGANVASSIGVSAGEVLQIGLGARGGDATGVSGANAGGTSGFTGAGGLGGFGVASDGGGGGGGASVVRIAGTDILISAGGGGGGEANGGAGLSPTPTGGTGGSGTSGFILRSGSEFIAGSGGGNGSSDSEGFGGGGGTGSAGGAAGDRGLLNSATGTLYNGGNGGANVALCSAGGGGGGYYGGGGGGGAAGFASAGCGGGGAGSSYMSTARTGTNRIYSESATSAASRAQINFIDFSTSSLGSGTVGQSYTENVVATFGAGTTPDVWSVSPALPAGLALNTATGAITGTPTEAANATYTITASYNPGNLGLIARSAISLTLVIASVPSADTSPTGSSSGGVTAITPLLSGTGGPWKLSVGVPALVIPATNSGTFARYMISPALPEGLQLDSTSGVITGTARVASPMTFYTLTATNAAGSSSLSFQMSVDASLGSASSDLSTTKILRRVSFPAGLNRVPRSTKQQLRREMQEWGGVLRISSEVTDPLSSLQMKRAYARGIALRKFLRVHGATVESRIALVPQAGPNSAPSASIWQVEQPS